MGPTSFWLVSLAKLAFDLTLTLDYHNVARWLRCLHSCLTARRSWVRFLHGELLALGGTFSAQVGYLPGLSVCMFSPCSQGVSSTKNPNRKTCKKSLTETDGSLGPQALRSYPLLLEEGRTGMGKCRSHQL